MSDDEDNVLLPALCIDERILQGIEQTIAIGRQRHIPAAIILEMIQFWLTREPARQEGGEQDGMAKLYGPAATTASYSRGQVVVYDDHGDIENGKIVYIAAQNEQGQPDLHYIVSPESKYFPTPVWPHQIIAPIR